MVTVDQETEVIKIAEIPSSVIGFDLPYCYDHHCFYKVKETIRKEDEESRRLDVTRKCKCPECQKSGDESYKLVKRYRVFKKSAPGTDKCNKITIYTE